MRRFAPFLMLAAATGLVMETSLAQADDDRNPPPGEQLENLNDGETPAPGRGRRRGRGNRSPGIDGGPIREGSRGGHRHHGPPPIIAALDADDDGVISSSEIDGAVTALKALDRNGDGDLTMEELHPDRPGRGGSAEGNRGERRRGGPPGGEFGQRGPVEGDRGEHRRGGRGEGPPPVKFVEKMMESDTDGDGLISRDEASDRLLRGFDRIDADGNGSIDKLELEQVAKRFT